MSLKVVRELSVFIPAHVRGTTMGEGVWSFPYFFLFAFLISFSLAFPWFPPFVGAQQTEKGELSIFDRLAEEATLLNKRGQPEKVIALLEPYKGDKKNDSALFFNELGVAYRQRGNFRESIASYQEALKRDPENPVIKKNLGDAFFFNKELSQAIAQYQKALEANPRFYQAHFSLGMAYYQEEKYREALEEFETVINLNPQNEQAKKLRETIRTKLKEKK
jgi:tetratricopeptide (TPR) repeat protein